MPCHCDQTSRASLSLVGVLSQQLQQLQLLQLQQLLATQLSRFSPSSSSTGRPRRHIAQIYTLLYTFPNSSLNLAKVSFLMHLRFCQCCRRTIISAANFAAAHFYAENQFVKAGCSNLHCRFCRGEMGNSSELGDNSSKQLQLKAAAASHQQLGNFCKCAFCSFSQRGNRTRNLRASALI